MVVVIIVLSQLTGPTDWPTGQQLDQQSLIPDQIPQVSAYKFWSW